MARYIDANPLYALVDKAHEIALNKLLDTPKTLSDGELNPMYIRNLTAVVERAHFKEEIFDAPIADVVEVVRCKDCIYSQDRRACSLPYGENGYCPLGERREDEKSTKRTN